MAEIRLEWRPGMVWPEVDQLVEVGQEPRRTPPSFSPWVLAVCGLAAHADLEPIGVRCPECLAWLEEHQAAAPPGHQPGQVDHG